MNGAFPSCLEPLLNGLNAKAEVTRLDIGGIDVVLHEVTSRLPSSLVKALCIAPLASAAARDGLAGAFNRLITPCIECIIIACPSGIQIQDLANSRTTIISETAFSAWHIDCITRYVDTGHVIFLDPLFEDPDFLKHCWAAFSRSMAMLERAGVQCRDSCVRMALQFVLDLCISSWHVPITSTNSPFLARMDMHGIDGGTMAAINDAWHAIPGIETRLDERILGYLMEQSILAQEKKQTGSYYTPRAWAWYTCHEALLAFIARSTSDGAASQVAEQDLRRVKVIDPAIGSGDFLEAMALDLVDAWLPHLARDHARMQADWNALRMRAKLEYVFKHNLHGIDVSKLAVDVTRARFFLNVARHVARDPSLGAMLHEFDIDLVDGDFLTRSVRSDAYDIVVGNPPYLMEVRNNQALFRHYSKHPSTRDRYEPKMDLFYFFMFKGVEVLRDGGILGFIVQEYWLDRYHARRLREFMFTRTAIIEFTMFKKCKVFTSAPGQHTMIIVARRAASSTPILARIVTVHDAKLADMQLLGELLVKGGSHARMHHVENGRLYDPAMDKVFASGDSEQGLFERMHAIEHWCLQADAIQVGINIPQPFVRRGGKVEGVFVIPRAQVSSIATSTAERSLIKPFHKATDINAYQFSPAEDLFIIYTTNEAMKRVEMERDAFSGIRAHLDRYASAITSDHRPYGLHRPRQPSWFESREKILGVRKARSPRFAVVPQDYYIDQALLVICLDASSAMSPYYACAFLNSPVAFQLFSGIKTQGGQLQIDKSVLTRIPIPACHAADHLIITGLSCWLHVLGMLSLVGKALARPALANQIRGIIDSFFNHLVELGNKEPLLAADAIDEVPVVTIAGHLVKRACIPGVDGLESTVVDIHGLFASVTRALPILERVVARLASDAGC